MSLFTGRQVQHQQSPRRREIAPPAWVRDWAGTDVTLRLQRGFPLLISSGSEASFVAVTVPGAAALAADAFERCAIDVYRAIRSALATLPHEVPVRFWNYLPGIHERIEQRRDRYMVFNAGRFAAMSDWFGGPDCFPGRLPAASGVGHRGDDLVVHCLACAQSGQAVENPRQIPAFRYSKRYGPLPPCFSRATVIPYPGSGGRALLIAGTASILGEQTVHACDLPRQLKETFMNLQALLATVQGVDESWSFTDLRTYYPRPQDAQAIERILRAMLGPQVRLEMVQAELCREDLLVEVEALATRNAGARRE